MIHGPAINTEVVNKAIDIMKTKEVSRFQPTVGTIICIVAFNRPVSFIVPIKKERLIQLLLLAVEANKAWSTNLFEQFLSNFPTMPVPAEMVNPLPTIKVDPNLRQISWTDDGWCSWASRTYDWAGKEWASNDYAKE